MTSVLPNLERDLVAAAARRPEAHGHSRLRHAAGWIGRRSRPARLLLGLAVVSAAAASAATLLGTSSLPLRGAITGDERYRVTLAPWLDAGVTGWCLSEQEYTAARPLLAGSNDCSITARRGAPLVAVSAGGPLTTVVTASNIAAVRVAGGPTVLTRADPHLPDGFRAAVFRSRLGSVASGPQALTALDSKGRPIPGGVAKRSSLPTTLWARAGERSAVSGALLSFPRHGGPAARTPPSGGCITAAASGSGLRALGGADVIEIVAADAIVAPAFLDCSDTLYAGEGTFAMISVLLDAKDPGAAPAALPDSVRVPGATGFYVIPTPLRIGSETAIARRAGNAWLVASSTSLTRKVGELYEVSSPPISRAQQIRMLRGLTIASIRLQHARRP